MIAYPSNVRWLSYGRRDRFKNLWRRIWHRGRVPPGAGHYLINPDRFPGKRPL